MSVEIRSIGQDDYESWLPLWNGYNAFYGREGATSLDPKITELTWSRFFESSEPVFALVAMKQGRMVGTTHFLFHRSTTRAEDICYLQDLFTAPDVRGQGIGRASIAKVYEKAKQSGARRVYWQTHETNLPRPHAVRQSGQELRVHRLRA